MCSNVQICWADLAQEKSTENLLKGEGKSYYVFSDSEDSGCCFSVFQFPVKKKQLSLWTKIWIQCMLDLRVHVISQAKNLLSTHVTF